MRIQLAVCSSLVILLLSWTAASLSPRPFADITKRASSPAANLKAQSSILFQPSKSTNLQFDSCYVPAHGLRIVSTQDALLVLGMLGASLDFDAVRTWRTDTTLASYQSASIKLIHHGQGADRFSKSQVAIKALALLWYCVVENHAGLGGALDIGGRGVFYVILHAPLPQQDTTPSSSNE